MSERKMVINPRASGVLIANNPKHVTIHRSGIERLCDEVNLCVYFRDKEKIEA